jgi:glycosyltransferase involved in cell wall biosynthesis
MTDRSKTLGFYCSSTSFGGLELHMVRLASWMQARGWKTLLYVIGDSDMAKEGERLDLTIRPIRRNRKYFDIYAASQIRRAFERDGVDIVWLRDNRDLSVAGIAKSLSGSKIKLVYQQAMALGVSKKDLVHTMRFKKIDAWLSSLSSMADQVKENTRFSTERLHVVPLGMELSKFAEATPSKQEAREKLELPTEPLFIGNIGRFGPKKQQDILIKGLEQIRKDGNDVHLLLVGESTKNEGDTFLNSLHELIAKCKLEDYVHFRPYMQDVLYFYRSIDIFALSSLKETYGMVTIEAMAAGLPVVATNSGGTVEILKSGELGALYEPTSASDFAVKVISLLEDTNNMQAMGALAQTEASSNYSNKIECQRIEEIISTL